MTLGAALVWFCCAISANWSFRDQWVAASPKTYFSNLQGDLNRLQSSGERFSLFDTPVPETAALSVWWPQNLLSGILPIGYRNLTYNDLQRNGWMADPATGHLVRAQFTASVVADGDRLVPAAPGPRTCLGATSGRRELAVAKDLGEGSWLLEVVGTPAVTLSSVTVTLSHADGPVSTWNSGPLSLEGERAVLLLSLPSGDPRSVRLSLGEGNTGSICGVAIGVSQPASGR